MTERTLSERLRDVDHADDYARIEAADALDAKSALLAEAEKALNAVVDWEKENSGKSYTYNMPMPQVHRVLAEIKAAQSEEGQ